MDIDLCRRIQCGAVSQSEAGLDALLARSQAGMVGAKGCGHPDCVPYLDEMRARGVCPPAYTAAAAPAPAPTPAATPVLPSLMAPLPSITGRALASAPYELLPEPWYCPVNRWANQHRFYAVLLIAVVYAVLGAGRKR